MHETTGSFAFIDLVGYTAASWTHGDHTAARLSIRLSEIAAEVTGAADELVKSIGDAVMVRSPEPRQMLGLIGRIWELCDREPRFPRLRAGAHHGPVVEHGGDYYGTTVNIAARVAERAAADEILITPAMGAAAQDAGWRVQPLGPTDLRNLGEPIELARLQHTTCGAIHIDPVCFMRVDPEDPATIALHEDHDEVFFCSTQCAATYRRAGPTPER